MESEVTYLIVGGGIAGVSCAEQLSLLCPSESVLVVSASTLIKAVTNVTAMTRTLTRFDVEEQKSQDLERRHPSIKVLHDVVVGLDSKQHVLYTKGRNKITYKKLCICAGGHPKLIAERNPYVIGIRDTESVRNFLNRIKDARRVVLVGNGGIATELVYKMEGVDLVWAVKDKHIAATFVDAGAAEFFLPMLNAEKDSEADKKPVKRMQFTASEDDSASSDVTGSALGPDWYSALSICGPKGKVRQTHLEHGCEVKCITLKEDISKAELTSIPTEEIDKWPVFVTLTNGKTYGCDMIISATGVIPNSELFAKDNALDLADDLGIKVDYKMETSVRDVFAAGDVCTASWNFAQHWFQMRLWTQARQMGLYAAKCMAASLAGEDVVQDFCFELFSHVTSFFGFKVILLGLFNGQKLDNKYDILLRVTKGVEYIKLVLKDGRMQGAVLIGDTDLEEMCENLILNQMDVSSYGEDLLNPDIDIEDYFD